MRWPNLCKHAPTEFVDTVMDERGRPIDVYVYDDHGTIGTCARYGDEIHQYASAEGSQDVGFRLFSRGPVSVAIAKGLLARGITPDWTLANEREEN